MNVRFDCKRSRTIGAGILKFGSAAATQTTLPWPASHSATWPRAHSSMKSSVTDDGTMLPRFTPALARRLKVTSPSGAVTSRQASATLMAPPSSEMSPQTCSRSLVQARTPAMPMRSPSPTQMSTSPTSWNSDAPWVSDRKLTVAGAGVPSGLPVRIRRKLPESVPLILAGSPTQVSATASASIWRSFAPAPSGRSMFRSMYPLAHIRNGTKRALTSVDRLPMGGIRRPPMFSASRSMALRALKPQLVSSAEPDSVWDRALIEPSTNIPKLASRPGSGQKEDVAVIQAGSVSPLPGL